MSLTNHPYFFVSEKAAFFERNREILAQLENVAIGQVYAAWDCIGREWFREAPMLVKTSAGTLSVHVAAGVRIAIGWNDISLQEKPRWFDETQADAIRGLGWKEDLEWREYPKAASACGGQIERIRFHAAGFDGGVGVGLACRFGKCLWLYDAGDVIDAEVDGR